MTTDKKKPTKKKSSAKNKGGRPSKYKPEFDRQAHELCLLGAIDQDLARFFRVNKDTIEEWKKKHKGFSDSLKKAKQEADAKVVKSLYQRAIGYEHEDLFITQYKGEIVKEKIIKHYPPSEVACIFWLKNRDKDNWRDKVDHEVEQKEPFKVIIEMIGSNGKDTVSNSG